MKLTKSENNNAIIVRLQNVRKHPNADRLKLATVLGTTVIVGWEAKEDDLMVYFDSNLRLSHTFLYHNNLYSSSEMNIDSTKKGYFGKNGKVRAQKFRGEMSNGYVIDIDSLFKIPELVNDKPFSLRVGDEFVSINGIEICSKYIVPTKHAQRQQRPSVSKMFHKHWDTKQLMRELDSIPDSTVCWIEEKIHGTSGRTGNVLVDTKRSWWKFWAPKQEWKIISGTRRVDNINHHIPAIRQEIERRVAPHLHRGETIYYEIYGYDGGKMIQPGYPYDCRSGEFKAMLYRVTQSLPPNVRYRCPIDLSRKQVYARALELGMEQPFFIGMALGKEEVVEASQSAASGMSRVDAKTLCEGVVVWFEKKDGNWTCLKYKSPEFLLDQDKRMEKNVGDVEDEL